MISPEFLFECAWRSSLVLAVGLAFLFVGRKLRLSASLLHTSGVVVGIIALVAPPIVALGWQFEVLPSFAEAAAESSTSPTFTPLSEITPAPAIVEVQEAPKSFALLPHLPMLLWILGVGSLIVFSIAGQYSLSRLSRNRTHSPNEIQTKLNELLKSLGLRTPVSVVVAREVTSPFTWGTLNPRIALPLESSSWPSEKLSMVLLHELAHVKRKDSLALVVIRILITVFWFNPLAWLLNRQLVHLREEACDSLVLSNGTPATDYAELLLHLAADQRPLSFSTAVSEPITLETRIKMILNPNSFTKNPPAVLQTVLLTCAMIFAIGAGTLGFAQEKAAAKPGAQAKKLEDIIIPKLEFRETSPTDGIAFLVQQSKELDPDKKGVNIVLKGDFTETKLTLRLENIPLSVAVGYIAELSNASVEHKDSVTIIAKNPPGKKTAKPVSADDSANDTINEKLENIVIPKIEFVNIPMNDALSFVRLKSKELDTISPADDKGINILLKGAPESRITLKLSNTSLLQTLNTIASVADLKMEVAPHAVMLSPK